MDRGPRPASWFAAGPAVLKFEAVVENAPAVQRALAEIGKRGARKAAVQALNAALKPEPLRQEVAAAANVPQKALLGRIKIFKASVRNLAAAVYFNPQDLRWPDLTARPHRETGPRPKGGVVIGRRRFSRAFFARLRGGKAGYYERVGAARLPIRAVGIPIKAFAVAAMRGARRRARREFDKQFPIFFEREKKRILAKAAR